MIPGFLKSNWPGAVAAGLLAAACLSLASSAWARPAVAAAVDHSSSPTAEIPPPPPPWQPDGPLIIDQALQRALASDPQIAILQAAVEVAHEQRLAATDLKDPEVKGQTRTDNQSGNTSFDELDNSRIALEVPVPNPWLMVPHVDARAADYQAAKADLQAATWLLTCEVRKLFAQLDYLTNDLAFSAELVRWNGEILTAVQARAQQGAATASDLMTATRQNVQAQNDFEQATLNYQTARQQLAALLDISPDSFELATNRPAVPALPASGLNFQKALATAAAARCDLAALILRAQAAASSYHEVRNQKIPWFTEVQAGYIDDSTKDSDNYWVGLAVDVPIFSWTKNHAADAAQAQARLAAIQATNGLRQIRLELHDALNQLDQTWRQQTRFENSVSPLITTMRQTLETLKNTPNVMPEQVAAVELQLVDTLRLDLSTRWQYHLALLNFERTLGSPLSQ